MKPESDEFRRLSSAVDPDAPPMLELPEGEVDSLADGQIRSGKLAGHSMWSAIWILSIPVLAQQMLAATVGLADKMIAGFLPDGSAVPALDGIGIGAYVAWFIGIAMTGVGVGAQAIVSRAIGAGRLTEANEVTGRSLGVGLVWGIAVGAALYACVDPLIHICSLEGKAAEYCRQYVQVMAIAMPLTGIMTVGSMCLHGAGEATKPAYIALCVNVVNVLFAWLLSGVELRFGDTLIAAPLPIDPGEWGVMGIALGTAISYGVGALLTVVVLFRGVKDLRPTSRDLRPTWPTTWRIARVGIPNFLEGISLWAVNLFVMAFIGMIALTPHASGGTGGLVGAHMIAVQWEAFSFLPGFAMGAAAAALAGQYLGAGNAVMARKAVVACTGIAIAIMGSLGVLLLLLGEPLTRIISREPVHLAEVPKLLMICGAIQVFFAVGIVIRGGLRGAGDTTWVLLITVVSSYGVRLPLAWLLGVKLGGGLAGIWYGLCGELVVRGILFWWRFQSDGWLRRSI
ncbi:MAG: MATE family efflux transporter [Phycisphaerales bacterium]|nr:MATE family efflux transporter [Phycisphaerales bacterium]